MEDSGAGDSGPGGCLAVRRPGAADPRWPSRSLENPPRRPCLCVFTSKTEKRPVYPHIPPRPGHRSLRAVHPAPAPGHRHPRVQATTGPQGARKTVLPNWGRTQMSPHAQHPPQAWSLLSLRPGRDGVKPNVAARPSPPPLLPAAPCWPQPAVPAPILLRCRGWAAPI